MGLGEECLEFPEALQRIFLLVDVEINPGLVLRLSLTSMLIILLLMPGSNLRANIQSIIIRQNLVHFQFILVSELL